ncbi:MAG: oxidoreductase [Deltaproteobacteria bacterium]|nr:MAG: oxidoreductase [Deltaproteobacteria bacterium]
MIGLGCMRLSTKDRPSREQALAVLHAALDGGVRLLDTADVYALDDGDLHHNEALIAEALAAWDGPRHEVVVCTKGGLSRPKGAWVPDGRAGSLLAAAEGSREALAVDAIDLYLLHAPDPRTKLGTSVRALKKLRQAGVVREIGLCNVRVHELEEAQRIVPITAIQVGISVYEDESLRNGVVRRALDAGLTVYAHSPFGGTRARHRVARDPLLLELAAKHGVSPHQIALAWVRGLDPRIVPLVGATRPASVRDSLASEGVVLDGADWGRLDEAFPAGRVLRVPTEARRPSASSPGEVVLLMGYPAAGKSSLARSLVDEGYARLNRDDEGGSLNDLLPKLDALLAEGRRRVVLDNTYPDRASRNRVVETAWARGVSARCLWLATDETQAAVNASLRMVARHGHMLGPAEIAEAGKQYANSFGPSALLRYRRHFEAPRAEEGFVVDEVPFERAPWTGEPGCFVHADVLWSSARGKKRPLDAGDVVFDEAVLTRLRGEPRLVVLHRDGDRSEDDVSAMFARVAEVLPHARTYWCGHPSGAPVCFCRKPYAGLAVQAVVEGGLDPARSVMVGASRADASVAEALGMRFYAVEDWLALTV